MSGITQTSLKLIEQRCNVNTPSVFPKVASLRFLVLESILSESGLLWFPDVVYLQGQDVALGTTILRHPLPPSFSLGYLGRLYEPLRLLLTKISSKSSEAYEVLLYHHVERLGRFAFGA